MTYDLLALDLDGTLLNSEHMLPADNRAALHRAHEAGLRIALCTGRAFPEMQPIIEMIGLDLDATVAVFGAIVNEVATGRTLASTPMSLDLGRSVARWFRAAGYPVMWLTDRNDVGHDGYLLGGPRRHPAVDGWLQRTPCRVHEVDDLPADAPSPLRLSIIDEGPELEGVSARMTAEFDGRVAHNVLHAPPYRLSLIETFAPQVNKWLGIEKLCQRWGIDPRRTVAVGDDVNDLAMIRQAALGVAVANAKPPVRAVADRIVPSNDECGVAVLIEQLLRAGG